MTDSQVSQVAAKALVQPTTVDRRTSQVAAKTLISVDPSLVQRRTSEIAVKALVKAYPSATGTASFSGQGSLAVDSFTTGQTGSADFTGTGTLSAVLGALSVSNITFGGVGTLGANTGYNLVIPGSIPFYGQGYLDLNVEEHRSSIAGFTGAGTLVATGRRGQLSEMVLQILDHDLKRAPTAVTVALANGRPNRKVEFYIDDYYVGESTTNTDGSLPPTSVNVPESPSRVSSAGEHHLKAEQSGSYDAEAHFELEKDPQVYPIAMGPDAQAVDVPSAVAPDGTRAWILQDLHPAEYGGIGSYVMPYNPIRMSNPHLERQHTVHPTTVPVRPWGDGGKFHVMQGGTVPKQWTFEGYCPTKEMQTKLLQYKNLNRRFYIIDHRRRAWKVLMQGIEFKARHYQIVNGQPTNWGHDYTATLTVLDQQWVQPAGGS